jgi:hypothetical protein
MAEHDADVEVVSFSDDEMDDTFLIEIRMKIL